MRPVHGVVITCALLIFGGAASSQNITLKWPKQPTSQPAAQAGPDASPDGKQPLGAVADRGPLSGSIVGRTYTNKFFDFSLKVPGNWTTLFINQGPKEDARGDAYALLCVGSRDRRMSSTRWIVISAVRPRDYNLDAESAPDAVQRLTESFNLATSMELGGGSRIVGKPNEILLGGRRMTHLRLAVEVDIRGSSYDTQWSELAVVDRGYLLMFIGSDPEGYESETESAAKALDSLRFVSEGDASAK